MKQHTGLIAGAALAGCLLIGGVFAWLWLQWQALDASLPQFTMTLRILFFTVPPAFLLALVWQRWGRTQFIKSHHKTQQMRAENQHARQYPQIIEGELVSGRALPDPIEVVKPQAEWMSWVDEQPHILLAGRTKAGKTHTATALLARRLRNGEQAYLVDPHSSGWFGLPTVGFVGMLPDGKPDTAALNAALLAVAGEYIRRMQARDAHKAETSAELPHDHWPRLTILIDEANYIADVLPTIWREFIKALASGGRKVGISLLCLVQSPLVEDIGCSGSMRANFARLGLDDRTVQQLISSDEKDADRKKALSAALVGRERPAGATIDAQVWLLDRANLDAGSAPRNARALVWTGERSSTVSPMGESSNGNNVPEAVTSPRANSSNSSIVPTAAEIAAIAVALRSGTPSEVAKTLDGYHPRKYTEFKAKVDYVYTLMQGGAR